GNRSTCAARGRIAGAQHAGPVTGAHDRRVNAPRVGVTGVGRALAVVITRERVLVLALSAHALRDAALALVAIRALEALGLRSVRAGLAADAGVDRATVGVAAAVVRVPARRLAGHLPGHADREAHVTGLAVVQRIVRDDPDLPPAGAVAADVVVGIEGGEPRPEACADPPLDRAPAGDLVEHLMHGVTEVDAEEPWSGGAVHQQVAVAQEDHLEAVRLDGGHPRVARSERPL